MIKGNDKKRKRQFDQQVDKLYAQFCDLILSFEEEREVTEGLQEARESLSKNHDKKVQRLRKVRQKELKQEAIDREYFNELKEAENSFKPLDPLNSQVIQLCDQLSSQKQLLQSFNNQIMTLKTTKDNFKNSTKIINKRQFSSGSNSSQSEDNSFKGSILKLTRYRNIFKDIQYENKSKMNSKAIFQKRNDLNKLLLDLNLQLSQEKGRSHSLSKQRIEIEGENQMDEYALKNMVQGINNLQDQTKFIKNKRKDLNTSITKLEDSLENKKRLLKILEDKNKRLNKKIKKQDLQKQEYEEMVDDNLDLKESISFYTNLLGISI